MGIFAIIAEFIGSILQKILPTFIAERKKPRESRQVGFDKDLEDDIDKTIEQEINDMIDDKNA